MPNTTLMSVTSALAIAWAGAATAQTAPADVPKSTPQAPSALQQPAAGPEAATSSEIIVTAQKRSQRLVDVPISISTASAVELERAGPTSLESLTKIVPGIYLNRPVYAVSPTIRGIGSTLSTATESNVSIYVDGVYHPTQAANLFDLASVSDVEVLKGPQGTLFGRNASGGALLVSTLDPSFTRAGKFNVSYERFGQVRSSAYLNVPLTDTLAVNGVLAYRYSRGYIRDLRSDAIVNEGRTFSARGKLLFQPFDKLKFVFTAAHNDFDDPTGSDYQIITPAPILTFPFINNPVTAPIATDRYHTSHNLLDSIKTSFDEYTLHATYRMGWATLSSITALQKDDLLSTNDVDSTYAALSVVTLPTTDKTFTQELNLTSRDNTPFTYVLGFYYYYRHTNVPYVLSNGISVTHSDGFNRSSAGYADGTYNLGHFSLTAGIRYTTEHRVSHSGPGADPAPYARDQEVTENKLTPRAVIRYSLAHNTNVYASYTQGYKSGVFNGTSLTGSGAVPETVNAYEIGYKTSSRPFSLNAAGFYYDYTNLQANTTTVTPGNPPTILTLITNAGKARIYGGEVDAKLRLNDAFDVRAAFAYTHARYTSFPSAQVYALTRPAPAPGFPDLRTFSQISFDASGHPLVRAPEYTLSGTANYHVTIGDGNRLDLSISPYYSSSVFFDFASTLRQPPYLTLDAAASLTLDERTKISVFGRNLTDKSYRTYISASALGVAGSFAQPRVLGASLAYSF